jgi:hypothetical protein
MVPGVGGAATSGSETAFGDGRVVHG